MSRLPPSHPAHQRFTLPQIYSFTHDPDTELYTEPHGFPVSQQEGSVFTDCLTFNYEMPWRVVLMVYHTEHHATANLFIRLTNGLFELNQVSHNRTPDEVFATHTRHVAAMIRQNNEHEVTTLETRAHLPKAQVRQNLNHLAQGSRTGTQQAMH